MDNQTKKLHRSATQKMIAGVCGGLGEYFNIDPILFRILFVALTFANGVGVIFYIILAIIVPKETGKVTQTGQKEKGEEYGSKVQGEAGREADESLERRKGEWFSRKRNVVGLIIILLGLGILLNEFIPFFPCAQKVFWPAILIIIGIYFLFSRKRN